LRDGSSGDLAGDRRIPASLGESIEPAVRCELFRHSSPPAREVTLHDPDASARVGPDVSETAPEHRRELQAEFLGQPLDLGMGVIDHVAAGLGVLRFGEPVSYGQHTPPDTVARFDDGDIRAQGRQIAGGGQAGQASPGDENGHSSQLSIEKHCTTLFGKPCLRR
jgi:hypothetical protein